MAYFGKLALIATGAGLAVGAVSIQRPGDLSPLIIRTPTAGVPPTRKVIAPRPLNAAQRRAILVSVGSKTAKPVGEWHFGAPSGQSSGTIVAGSGLDVNFATNSIRLGDSPSSALYIGHTVTQGQFFVIDISMTGPKVELGDEYKVTVVKPQHGHVVAVISPNNGGQWTVSLLPVRGVAVTITGIDITDYVN
ncbi:MAG TPA: hypothetical protein VKT78_02460 [Fimbriimonadaceae bacterium]|nr:hypothetical protein [Fimbriimonadaceae bacterium]